MADYVTTQFQNYGLSVVKQVLLSSAPAFGLASRESVTRQYLTAFLVVGLVPRQPRRSESSRSPVCLSWLEFCLSGLIWHVGACSTTVVAAAVQLLARRATGKSTFLPLAARARLGSSELTWFVTADRWA